MSIQLKQTICLSLAILFVTVGCIMTAGCTGTEPAPLSDIKQQVSIGVPVPGTDPSGAQAGDNVTVDYVGKLDSGDIFDTSIGRGPLVFSLGDGTMIPGFEKAIYGMKQNETKTFTIPFDEAYGPRMEELVIEVPMEKIELPEGVEIKPGDKLWNGFMEVQVVDIANGNVTIDQNHFLAGKDLTFEIVLTGLKKSE
ncbi:MAG: FKBP-type peptidyl-prolyl cis-trans isomerase [Methanospirillaceae archaeon]|nr:FKBP-type peptidyl-prolyl cis-trans isomerase [Methanospirillaceae archaeon]